MPKYNEFEILFGGVQYVFVTRGRSKVFDTEEALSYLKEKHYKKENELSCSDEPVEPVKLSFPDKPVGPVKDAVFEDKPAWRIPDDKMRRHMFRTDLQEGMPFCIRKYGQTAEVIQAEATRLASGGH